MSGKRRKTTAPAVPDFFTALREHWGVANSDLEDSATFLASELEGKVGDDLTAIARAMWDKYLAAAFPPDQELEDGEGYGSKQYVATCRSSFALKEDLDGKVSEVEEIQSLLEGVEEESAEAVRTAFDEDVEKVVVADVSDDELLSGCVVVAKRGEVVFGWIFLNDT
eukprot:TRINITY_DN45918_c0_g1_i1.p1 TRINITY_DN45918_c0_g1~~TRINITY_DN45918_c0_g1_i1.p1  ORF type:complete len:167 (+),score=43.28 TRINITY_DN45918_c0_g1_i1:86-586(+)